MKITQIKKLSKAFKEKTDENKIIPEDKRQMYLDPANVMGIIPKTENFRELFLGTFNVEGRKTQSINWECEKGVVPTGAYSTEYLKLILGFVTVGDADKVKITSGNDSPLKVENDECIIILAPRVEVEE